MKKTVKITISTIISISIILSMVITSVAISETSEDFGGTITHESKSNYSVYINNIKDKTTATENIDLGIQNLISDYTNKTADEMLPLDDKCTNAKFSFSIPKEGLYNIKLTYLPSEIGTADIEIGLKIDGNYPFSDAQKMVCFRNWTNSSEEWRVDSTGNEFTTEQIQTGKIVEQTLLDKTGVYTDPFLFFFTKGSHEIEILLEEESFALKSISLVAPQVVRPYEEIRNNYVSNSYKEYSGLPIIIEAENAYIKTSNSLTAKSDTNSVNVTPKSTTTGVVNFIGGENWNSPGDELTWNFHIDKSGLYKLGFSYKQSYVMNGSVYRSLKIDNITPFKEASSIAFPYNSAWEKMDFADIKSNPYLLYLEEGDHTISMSVTLGVMADFYKRLSDIVELLGQEYLSISMITGETPDANRDYELFKQIPELESVLSTQEKELITLMEDMEKASGLKTTKYSSVLRSMAQILKQMLAKKYLAHTYKSEFYSKYVSLSASLSELQDMALALDQIYLVAPDENLKKYDSSFFASIGFHVKRFIYSFSNDYLGDNTDSKNSIKLWINWGNDQAQVLSSLIQESFTPKTGINVKFQLVNTSIIQGILTNNQPDVVLHMDRSNPVNYAMRGALYPLNSFEDFDIVLEQFMAGSEEPYKYNENCYALPDTQSYYVMFYRSDVLKQLNIEVPKTWEEFEEALSVIQRNNMNAYFPYVKPTGITGSIGQLNLFATLLTQKNISVYNSEHNANVLNNREAINVFEKYTDFYTKYKIPVTADFYNRFRLGVTPLGIAPYTQYTVLKAAASEIDGKWGIAPIPGVVLENGKINNVQCGSGTGCCILNKSNNKEAAWEFLKWWTSSDIQRRYSQNLESILGPTARIATSNVVALCNYSWNVRDKEILLGQWKKVVEIPEVPGSYHLARSLDQAFLEVVNNKSTPNDALIKWMKLANNEIERKIAEYQ